MLRAVIVTVTLAVTFTTGTPTDLAAATNSARPDTLPVSADLSAVAQQHSAVMAEKGLHHNPRLGQQVTGWTRLGENVGAGPSISSIHDAFMRSPGHRANILDPGWTDIGVGVTVSDGRLWVVVIFRTQTKPANRPAPSTGTGQAAPGTERPQPPAPVAEPSPAPAPIPRHLDRTLNTLARIEAGHHGSPPCPDPEPGSIAATATATANSDSNYYPTPTGSPATSAGTS